MTTDRAWQSKLQVERLESRQMMAGNVAAAVHGQMLVLWGDDAANSVVLTYNSTTQTYRVLGRDAGGSPTTINGLDTSLPATVEFSGVQQVAVILHGGNDEFEVGSPQAVETVISKWLSIEMGQGNDKVVLGRAGNAPGGAAPVATRLRTGTGLNVDLGAGDDHLELANAEIGLGLNIVAGEGNDEVLFATSFTPPSATEPTLFPVHARGNCVINLGGGEDELDLHNAVVNGHLRILDGFGPAHLNLHNIAVGKNVDIDTAGDADVIAIDFVHAKGFTLDTNGGIDDIDVTNSRFRTVNVKLGASRDQLLLRNVKVSWLTHLDGGPGGSALARGPGNQLRGLTRRNIG